MDPFLGEVRTFTWNYAPRGWAICNGQMIPIPQNQALFSLLGTTYGGNGVSTFGLPDLQGRAPLHFGTGGGQTFALGQVGGAESVTLQITGLPQHTHTMRATTNAGDQTNATGGLPATASSNTPTTVFIYGDPSAGSDVMLAADTTGLGGGNGQHNNMQPFLALNFCIALQGIYPARS